MNHPELLQDILSMYNDKAGLVIRLRAGVGFDETEFRRIMFVLDKYADALGDQPDINRSVARFAIDLELSIEIALQQLEAEKDRDEYNIVKLSQAYAEASAMVLRLLY